MQLYGEDSEGSYGYRCPGESCDLFAATAGTFEERAAVCLDCSKCNKPPLLVDEKSTDLSPDIVNRVVIRIEKLYTEQMIFNNLNFETIDYFEFELLKIWQAKVLEMERLHKAKITAIFEGMMKT